jgi:phosphonate transport system substrate-binding protein
MPKNTSLHSPICVESVMNPIEGGPSSLRKSNRRSFLSAGTAALGFVGFSSQSVANTPMRFATTPVFLNDQVSLLGHWQRYLESKIERPVRFIQRGTYREIVELLLSNEVDAAWLCGYPLVLNEKRLSALAVPKHQGAALYRSHLVVPESDTTTRSVLDLRNQVFAYSDPLSNSGCLVPRTEIQMAGHDASTFFRRTFFTFSHRKVIEAVRNGLANAGAVDGYVWDTLAEQFPSSVAGLRVAWRSQQHGFPPIVTRKNWGSHNEQALLSALLSMNANETGRVILKKLNIDGFGEPTLGQYLSIQRMLKYSTNKTS